MQIVQTNQNEVNPVSEHERGRSKAAGTVIKMCFFKVLPVAIMIGMPLSGLADTNAIPLVYGVENTGTNCAPPPLPTLGNLPLVVPLPDPFLWANGSGRSTNFTDWECHRNEIMARIQNYEIGIKPAVDPSQVTASFNTNTLTVVVTGTNGQQLTLTCPVSFPSGSGPLPVCIGMDSPYGALPSSFFTSRGIAGISYFESQVTTYNSPQNTDPFFKLYGPTQNINNTGQYAAWAWGVSRIIDALYKLNGTLGTNQLDLSHIAVTGCSYAGKLALFSGAFDERIALTIAQESGGGGANSWRYNHTETAGTVEDIDDTSYQWFSSTRMQQFSGNSVSYLPDDHHELDAMVAPRALYVTGNTDYTWLGNPSCYVCSRAVQQIYSALGISDRFGFNVDGNHSHCAFPNDQTNDLAYFLDKFMSGNTNLSSIVAGFPSSYSNINYARWYAWWGTSDPIFPGLKLNIPLTTTKGAGILAGQGMIGLNGITLTDVVVNLTSSDASKLTVPASVVISAGTSNSVFDLTVLGDSLLDGYQFVTVTATNSYFDSASATITIADTNSTTLSVSLPASASKTSGTLTNAGTVTAGAVVAANITVALSSSDSSKLVVPPNTVILAGQTSAVFNVSILNDSIIDGPQNVTVTAHVQNWVDGSNSVTILDPNLSTPFHLAWNPIASPQFTGVPFNVTVTALGVTNNPLDFQLPVSISALMVDGTAGTNSILGSPTAEQSTVDGAEYVLGYSFTPSMNMKVTHLRSYFGDNVSLWTAAGQQLASQNVTSVPGTWVDTPLPAPVVLLAGSTYILLVHENNVQYYWSVDLPASFAAGTINQSVWDYGNVFPPTQTDSSQWYFVDLRYATDVVSAAVSPGTSGTFTNGIWSGNMAVLQSGADVLLQATGAAGYGISSPFTVIDRPALAITALSNSVVVSWPTNAAGFNLEQASTLPNWTNDLETPSAVGDHYYITDAIGTNMFYQLHKP